MSESPNSDSKTDASAPTPGLQTLLKCFATPCALSFGAIVWIFDPLYRLATLLFLLPLFLHAASSAWWPGQHVGSRPALIQRCFRMVALVVSILGWGVVFILLGYVLMSLFTSYTLNNNTLLVIESLTPLGFMICAWFWWPAYAREVVPSWPEDGVRIRILTSTRWQRDLKSIAQNLRRTVALPQYHGFLATCGLILVVATTAVIGIFSGVVYRLIEVVLVLSLVPLHLIVVAQAEVVGQLWQEQAARIRSQSEP